ncbi:hypothetical protein Tco_1070399, partial [Tanacetum coccineum]
TKIHFDNESTICIVRNPVFHSKTKHIDIRHHFIRDSYEKKLIQMIKIHTDQNVTDLLTKAFDVSRFQYLINADFAEIVDFLNGNPISYIFDGMMRNLDSSKKFLMYPRFLQLFLNKQIENLSEVNDVYDTPHTKKIFTKMRRQGKDVSRIVTPLFSSMLVQQAYMGEGSGQPTDPQYTSTSVQPSNEEPITVPSSSQLKKTYKPRKAKRATKISQSSGPISLVTDETVTKEKEYGMERPATTASSLEAKQDSGSGPRCQYTILGDAKAQTRFETASKQSNNPPLSRVNIHGSREDRLKLKELMDLCTKLSDRVLALETTKTAQAKEIASLKKRVKKLERKRNSKTPGMNLFKIGTSSRRSLGEEDASKHGRNLKHGKQRSIFEESDFDDEGFDADMDEVFKDVEGDAKQVISVAADEVSTGDAVNTANMEVNIASALVTTADVSVSTAEPITTASVNITTAEPITPPTTTTVFENEDLTITQTLIKMRSEKSKMQAELEEEERLAREREEDANIVEWDNVQAMIDADYELPARL